MPIYSKYKCYFLRSQKYPTLNKNATHIQTMQEGSGGSFQTAVGPKDPKRSKHTWRIIPGLVSSQDHPHLKAMKRPSGRGPTTPGLGDLRSPWLLTTYPSHGMILQVSCPRHFRKFHAKTQDERSRQARANLPRSTGV